MANTNTSARYTMVAAKNRWEEQGFYFDDSLPNYGLEQFLYNRLNELGWRVPATAATINAILDLSDAEPSFYAMLGGFEEEDFELIKDYLCEENTAWNTTGRNPHSTVDRTRLLLIHTILTGYRINIGEILAKELAAACANDKGILAFPCLIYALCRRAAVPTSPGDKYQPEKTG
ncbi:hypothetical protein V6N13_123777 [Hibiscus sabdariffa]